MFVVIKKSKLILTLLIITFLSFGVYFLFLHNAPVVNTDNNDDEVTKKIEEIFEIRNTAILNGDKESIKKYTI